MTESTKTSILSFVNGHKNEDAILIWSIGNEVHLGQDSRLEEIFTYIDSVAAAVKEADPDHPTMTVIAELPSALFPYLRDLAHVDIIGINAYTYADSIGQRYTNANINKPFILTEYGPLGPWDGASRTSFGAYIEPTTTARTALYQRTYEETVIGYQNTNCLGSYAFLWGWKNETTPTWFGMFYRDGSRLGPVETVAELWSETLPSGWNRIPEVGDLTLSKSDQIRVRESITAECTAVDSDGDPLSWEFELIDEAIVGGRYSSYPSAIESVDGNRATVRPPAKGQFRIYAVVRDGHGNAAFASAPINVQLDALPETTAAGGGGARTASATGSGVTTAATESGGVTTATTESGGVTIAPTASGGTRMASAAGDGATTAASAGGGARTASGAGGGVTTATTESGAATGAGAASTQTGDLSGLGSSDRGDKGGGGDLPAILGGIFGSVFGIALIGGVVTFCLARRKRERRGDVMEVPLPVL
jgi:hypothetical protein